MIPNELLYTENHEWIIVEGKEALIGITDHAQEEMGDIVFVELPEKGDEFDQYDDFAVVESVKAVSDIYMPAGGEVIEINEDLLDQPELINEEPYEGGWLIRIKLADKGELEELMEPEDYREFIEEGE